MQQWEPENYGTESVFDVVTKKQILISNLFSWMDLLESKYRLPLSEFSGYHAAYGFYKIKD